MYYKGVLDEFILGFSMYEFHTYNQCDELPTLTIFLEDTQRKFQKSKWFEIDMEFFFTRNTGFLIGNILKILSRELMNVQTIGFSVSVGLNFKSYMQYMT